MVSLENVQEALETADAQGPSADLLEVAAVGLQILLSCCCLFVVWLYQSGWPQLNKLSAIKSAQQEQEDGLLSALSVRILLHCQLPFCMKFLPSPCGF